MRALPDHPFESRNIHPALPPNVKKLFDDGHYSQATFEAFKFVDKEVARLAKHSESGFKLMMAVFSGTSPLLKLNGCISTSEKDEQTYQRHWDLDEIVTFSGAALDFQQIVSHPSSRQLATIFNLDLGRYIPNPRLTRTFKQTAWWLTPLAHVFSRPHYGRDVNGTHIYLSDGGHSENLGAFSLVRRLCKTIVIVDAEEDKGYSFGAYAKLKEAISNEMGADLNIGVLQDLRASSCENITCSLGGSKKGITFRDQPGQAAISVNYAEFPDLRRAWKAAGKSPVMSGDIRQIPLRWKDADYPGAPEKSRDGVIDVHYVKLAYAPPLRRRARRPAR